MYSLSELVQVIMTGAGFPKFLFKQATSPEPEIWRSLSQDRMGFFAKTVST
jgi:hypothetical protein